MSFLFIFLFILKVHVLFILLIDLTLSTFRPYQLFISFKSACPFCPFFLSFLFSLREVLTRAKALPPLSQFVFSKPGRRNGVSPEMLTKYFRKFAKQIIESPHPPTFHEIRALGSHILESVEKRDLSI